MKVEGGHVEDGAGRAARLVAEQQATLEAGRAAKVETGWPGSG